MGISCLLLSSKAGFWTCKDSFSHSNPGCCKTLVSALDFKASFAALSLGFASLFWFPWRVAGWEASSTYEWRGRMEDEGTAGPELKPCLTSHPAPSFMQIPQGRVVRGREKETTL